MQHAYIYAYIYIYGFKYYIYGYENKTHENANTNSDSKIWKNTSYWLMRMKCQLCIELNFQVNDPIQCHNYNLVMSRQILPKHSFNFLKKK